MGVYFSVSTKNSRLERESEGIEALTNFGIWVIITITE